MQIQSQLGRRKKLSLTSLIDVIFLLLLFFMLSSTFSKFSQLKISAQGQGSGAAQQSHVDLVSVDGALIRINGQVVVVGELKSLLSQHDEADMRQAIVTTSLATTTQQLVDILIELSNVDGLAVTIAR